MKNNVSKKTIASIIFALLLAGCTPKLVASILSSPTEVTNEFSDGTSVKKTLLHPAATATPVPTPTPTPVPTATPVPTPTPVPTATPVPTPTPTPVPTATPSNEVFSDANWRVTHSTKGGEITGQSFTPASRQAFDLRISFTGVSQYTSEVWGGSTLLERKENLSGSGGSHSWSVGAGASPPFTFKIFKNGLLIAEYSAVNK